MAFLTLPLVLAGTLAASDVANRTLRDWVPLLVSADERLEAKRVRMEPVP